VLSLAIIGSVIIEIRGALQARVPYVQPGATAGGQVDRSADGTSPSEET